ncbi:uroporphyrinogen-III C-methyltransferase [Celerinatantimonas sp. YJH-8]|uniref:uroporphyrinogen-III C-methyltransferase n=1 Tax=Celerinatantimonas sp. YJH-8 TaxID=3228714 RepID=UPI0038C6A81D
MALFSALASTLWPVSERTKPWMTRMVRTLTALWQHSGSTPAPVIPVVGQPLRAGEVALVGAGPGDVELLTVAAVNLLQQADVVVYDRLVSPAILKLVPTTTRLICVGKAASFHSVPQSRINEILIEQSQLGARVVRLKGGDSFIFGRGGEELEQLAAAGLVFRVVPGITAASGCTTYAGIPLTHRKYAQAVTFITGHCKSGGEEPDWSSLAVSNHTLVIYMGRLEAQRIQEQLIAHGMDEQMPVAVIENGTRLEQRVLSGELTHLASLAHQAASPALLVIGHVVELRESLQWFEPLTSVAESKVLPESAL